MSLSSECEIEEGCRIVCENRTDDGPSTEDRVVHLKFMTDPYGTWINTAARDFEQYKQGSVKVEIVETPWDQVIENIVNEAVSKTGLMDGFITAPGVSGSVVTHDGWANLAPFISETADRTKDWADIVLGYRKYIAQYQEEIIMYPLDGDVLSMFYRKDILEHFGLPVPRTWDEYSLVSQHVHGKTYENETLVGSCVGRSCANGHWVTLMLSTMTQTEGPWSGHSFDSADMKPLTGVALEKAFAWLEDHVQYGPEDEFDKCVELNTEYMNTGQCVLTYNWGNSFKRYLEEGSKLRGDKFGVAPTPGSTKVLDRETMELVDCDEERCKYGSYHDDIGWVNRAPYLAYGGYACSVNNYTLPLHKRLATEFCAFAASTRESIKAVIPNATVFDETLNGQDPFRHSHLDLDKFVKQGYERNASEEYIQTIRASLDSKNAVIDNRFPTATDLDTVLRREVPLHLKAVRDGLIPESELVLARKQLVRNVERQWQEIMNDYEGLPTTQVSILESYQLLRGVYSPDVNQHYLGSIRVYGYVLVMLSFAVSVASALWVLKNRKTRIVQASQPFFLVLIIVGTATLGSSIIPMGIDEEVAGPEACNRACQSIPWLLTIGWTIVFAALFAKLSRINMVFDRASRFRRVAVTEKDVLHYFALLLFINLALLLTWTFVSPMEWTRIQESKTESYGKCTVSGSGTASNTVIAFVAAVNGIALVLANVAAFRARQIATEYSESRYIGMIMLSILQIVMVGVPILFLVEGNPTARFFTMSTIVFILCMSILLWMFVPKIIAWRAPRHERSQQSQLSSPGLEFRVRDTSFNGTLQDMHDVHSYRIKLASLEAIMREQGIDSAALFKGAGIDETFCSERSSSFRTSPKSSRRSLMRGIPETKSTNDVFCSEAVEAGSSPRTSAREAAVSSSDC